MLMKDILNIYQKDWAEFPTLFDEKTDKLKDATILVAGHDLARCFAYSLLMMNDKKKLNINVILAGATSDLEETLFTEVADREDFTYTNLNRVNTIKQKVDFIVYAGLCGVDFSVTSQSMWEKIAEIKGLFELAKVKNTNKIIMLSPCDVYGKGENKFRAFSEMELGKTYENGYVQLLRTMESYFISLAKEVNINSLIFRTGVILGADSGVYNGLDDVFKCVAENKEIQYCSTENKVSFIYLSDLFRGIIFALNKDLQGIYNIAGKKSASTNMVIAIISDLFDDVKFKNTKGDFKGSEINCEKLEMAGFTPKISLETALELSVLSYKTNDKNMKFPHEHQGRLSAIQELLLGYLLEVDRICKKHNITYYLGGGTLLGAARHQGFIPWDDDVDIMMLREDYDKFLKVAGQELPEGIILQDPKKDKNYYYCYAKLRLTDTVFSTDFSKHHKGTEDGFAFDIFCHDKTANSKLGQKLHSQLTLFWLAMVFNKWNNRKVDNGKKLQSVICNFLKNIFPLKFSMFMLLRTLEMFKHKRNAKYLYDGMGKSVHKGGFDKSFVENEIRVSFEGHSLPVPEKYKDYLTNHYGDFMELAPLSTRLLSHEITMCDLGKYSEFKISNGNNL